MFTLKIIIHTSEAQISQGQDLFLGHADNPDIPSVARTERKGQCFGGGGGAVPNDLSLKLYYYHFFFFFFGGGGSPEIEVMYENTSTPRSNFDTAF